MRGCQLGLTLNTNLTIHIWLPSIPRQPSYLTGLDGWHRKSIAVATGFALQQLEGHVIFNVPSWHLVISNRELGWRKTKGERKLLLRPTCPENRTLLPLPAGRPIQARMRKALPRTWLGAKSVAAANRTRWRQVKADREKLASIPCHFGRPDCLTRYNTGLATIVATR
jgi:hypothetical protein